MAENRERWTSSSLKYWPALGPVKFLMGADKLPGRLVPRQTKQIFVSPPGAACQAVLRTHLATVFASEVCGM